MNTTIIVKNEIKQIENLMQELVAKHNLGLVSDVRYMEYMQAFVEERDELVASLLKEQNARIEAIKAEKAKTSTEEKKITITVEDIPQAATEVQLRKYMELCLEKKYAPRNTQGWTRDIASSEIQKLLAHRAMSPKQKEMIKGLQSEASEAELIERTLNDTELTRVSGSQAGEAIGRLISLLQENSDKVRPSQVQIERIANMYPCPDVPFEDFDIQIMKQVTDNDGNVVAKRRITRKELEEAIRKNMSRYDAAKFISDNEPSYFAWKKTLITDSQIRQIRTLEKRLYNLSSPRQVEATSDIWGDIVDTVPQGSARDTKWTVDMAQVQIPEENLRLMTEKEARQFIAQLNIEIKAKGESNKDDIASETLQMDTQRNQFDSLANNDEFNDFNNLLFSLQAIAGYDVQEFQDETARIFFAGDEGTREAKRKLFRSILEFVELQLENKSLTALGLVEMTESTRLGRDMVKTLARKNDAVFEALVYA